MAANIQIINYSDEYEEKWDKFVLSQSVNGNILQTRRFLKYHPQNRFKDASVLIMNGSNIIAVVPANINDDKDKVCFISHQGSTFGGIVIGKQYCKISYMEKIMESFDEYIKSNGYDKVILKMPNNIFNSSDTSLLDYYFFKEGYDCSQELAFYIDYSDYPNDVISAFSSSRRRDYRYSLKNNLVFRELSNKTEIMQFYNVLCDNYTKFGKNPVHTYEELIDFKFNRLMSETSFYGVFEQDEMIAGAMIFNFAKRVFHTQYLAVRQDKKDIFANEFLYTNLIIEAREKGFEKMSFGTSTFDGGRVLNKPLALYKEGYGTKSFVNRTYTKEYK